MSFLSDKVRCVECGDLYDPDLLDSDGVCKDCRYDETLLRELISDELMEGYGENENNS